MPTRRAPALALALALAAAPASVAAADAPAPLAVEAPWARATTPAQANGAAYLTLTNAGPAPDRLVGAETPAARAVEIHAHAVDAAGVARMRPVQSVEVPAGGRTALEPGGLHLMLVDLARPLVPGEPIEVTLRFERAGALAVEVPVAPLRGGAPAAAGAAPAHGGGHGDHGAAAR